MGESERSGSGHETKAKGAEAVMMDAIRITGADEHNLKHIDVEIPYHKHTVITGVSGSGKSTLAYDVIYAAAQRRLMDCMSEREIGFGKKMREPKVENIEGLSTVISLKQIKPNDNPRSTIGTYTKIGTYVRSLMSIHGQYRCLFCENQFKPDSYQTLIKDMEALDPHTIVEAGFPYFFTGRSSRDQQIEALRQRGYRTIYVGDEKRSLRDNVCIEEDIAFIFVVESRFQVAGTLKKSDVNCLKHAAGNGDKYLFLRLSGTDDEKIQRFWKKRGCSMHHVTAVSIEASDFSCNDMSCACPECMGSGIKRIAHPSKVIKNPRKTLRQNPFFGEIWSMSHPYSYMSLYSLAKHYHFPFDEPYEQLSKEAKDLILYGSADTFILQRPEGYDKILPNYLAKEGKAIRFQGILTRLEELYREMLRDPEPTPEQEQFFRTWMHETECPGCGGTRLKKIKGCVMLCDKNYAQLGNMEFSELSAFLEKIQANEMSRPVLDALKEKLSLMEEIGCHYLSFGRRMDSLSGGEYQRLRIANQVGSGLVGLTYIIDEPTDGLHKADSPKVIGVIKRLLQKENTVITIEHDEDVIRAADYCVEMGPGAGTDGGKIVASGTPEQLMRNPDSMIGKHLLEKRTYPLAAPAAFDAFIRIYGIEINNVKGADIEIPLQRITCFTGVSGSGKSSIVYEVLYKALDSRLQHTRVVPGKFERMEGFEKIRHVVCIDQTPLSGKNTSVPATYLDLSDAVRMLFLGELEEDHEMKGKKSYFSFNSKGACPACRGRGYLEHVIPYLGGVRTVCPTCRGQQYLDEVLEVKYQGKNIKQVMDMTFQEAASFFEKEKKIYDKVRLACDLGLGYMRLDQPMNTLSGGEIRRMKFVKEMTRYQNKKGLLYLFDEPSVGLHVKDVKKLMEVMRQVVREGNTVVLVEHHPDMILRADYIIDLGPGAGKDGGKVMFAGQPFLLLKQTASKTAQYLRSYVGADVR